METKENWQISFFWVGRGPKNIFLKPALPAFKMHWTLGYDGAGAVLRPGNRLCPRASGAGLQQSHRTPRLAIHHQELVTFVLYKMFMKSCPKSSDVDPDPEI